MSYFDTLLTENTQAAYLAVRVGSQTFSDPKIITGMIGTSFGPELANTDLMQVIGQGATNTQIVLAANGSCGTATGESFTVASSYAGSQTTDGYGLQIPSAPGAGDRVQVKRDSRTGSRTIIRRPVKPQKRQWFLQDLRPLDGALVKHYGTYAYVDDNGVTHQPPGKRDPVVNIPGVGAHVDLDTIKFDANGAMYADLFGSGGANGSVGTSVNGLNAGHGIEIAPGFSPLDGPSIQIEAGGSVPAGNYAWAFCYVIDGKRTPLSPQITGTTIDGPPTAYHQPHLSIPGKPAIIHASALELYRKDASVGADGTIHTKFAYTTSPGVLITDASTGATKVTSGTYTGLYQYVVVSTHSGVNAGDTFFYNPATYVKVGDPPVPYDPRDGSLTTLVENGAADGSSVFKTGDGGAINPVTGDVKYPKDNPLNHSGMRLVDTLTPSNAAQDYIDTKTDAALGVEFIKDPTVISIKPARWTVAPYTGMASIPGAVPPVWELSGIGFNSADPNFGNDGAYLRTHEALVVNAQNNLVPFLAASATQPAVGAGKRTTMSIAGYSDPMYDLSSIDLYAGDNALGMQVRIDGTSITRRASDGALQTGAGTVAFSSYDLPTLVGGALAASASAFVQWDGGIEIDHGGWVTAGTDAAGSNMVIPATGTYAVSLQLKLGHPVGGIGQVVWITVRINGAQQYVVEHDVANLTNSILIFEKNVDLTLNDAVRFKVHNFTLASLTVDGGHIDLHKV